MANCSGIVGGHCLSVKFPNIYLLSLSPSDFHVREVITIRNCEDAIAIFNEEIRHGVGGEGGGREGW